VAVCHCPEWGHDTVASWTTLCKEPPIEFRENPTRFIRCFQVTDRRVDGWMDVVSMQDVLFRCVHKIAKSDYTSSCLSVFVRPRA